MWSTRVRAIISMNRAYRYGARQGAVGRVAAPAYQTVQLPALGGAQMALGLEIRDPLLTAGALFHPLVFGLHLHLGLTRLDFRRRVGVNAGTATSQARRWRRREGSRCRCGCDDGYEP